MAKRKQRGASRAPSSKKTRPDVGKALADLASALKYHRLLFLLLAGESPEFKSSESDGTFPTWLASARSLAGLPLPAEIADTIKSVRSVLRYEAALTHYVEEAEAQLATCMVYGGKDRTPTLATTFNGAAWLNESCHAVRMAAKALASVDRKSELSQLVKQTDAIASPAGKSKGWTQDRNVSWKYGRKLQKLEGRTDKLLVEREEGAGSSGVSQRRAGVPKLTRGKGRGPGRRPISPEEERHRINVLSRWDKVEGTQSRKEFCKVERITPKQLERFLNWRKKRIDHKRKKADRGRGV